jgi:hypothetical protein
LKCKKRDPENITRFCATRISRRWRIPLAGAPAPGTAKTLPDASARAYRKALAVCAPGTRDRPSRDDDARPFFMVLEPRESNKAERIVADATQRELVTGRSNAD